MDIWRSLVVALVLLTLGATTANAAMVERTPDHPLEHRSLTAEPVPATAAIESLQAAQDRGRVMLITGIAALAAIGVAVVIFLFRWATGKVRTPTAQEYEAAQQAIFGEHH